MEWFRNFLSEPWNAGLGAWATVIGTIVAVMLLFIKIRRLKPVGGRGGDAIVEDADGTAIGGKGGKGGYRIGSGGDGGSAKVVGGTGKAVGGDGGDVRS